jgi:hypothetical protein
LSYLPDLTHKLSLLVYSAFCLIFILDLASTITAFGMPNPNGYLIMEGAVGGIPAVVINTLGTDAIMVFFFGVHRGLTYFSDTQQLSDNIQVGIGLYLTFLDLMIIGFSVFDLIQRGPAVFSNLLAIVKIGGWII